MGNNLVIVALPAEDEAVRKVSSEKEPHLTLLFLGDAESNPNVDRIFQFVHHAVNISEHGPFYLDVDHRGILGEDKADVLFFRKDWTYKWIDQFRNQLLQNTDIRKAYDSVEQFPEWRPHLTLGYPETPAHEDKMPEYGLQMVRFDRIAVWTEDSDGPWFRLERPDREEMEVMMSDKAETGQAVVEDLLHVGVKGMRWGVRKEQRKEARAQKIAKKHDTKFEKPDPATHTLIHNLAVTRFNQKIEGINSKPQYKAAADRGDLNDEKLPITKQYHNEVDQMFRNQIKESANSVRNYSGTRQYDVEFTRLSPEPNDWGWSVKTTPVAKGTEGAGELVKVAHADDATIFKAIVSPTGVIVGVSIDSMTQVAEEKMDHTAELGEEFIEHFGVKGMRWGVRKDQVKSVAKSVRDNISDHGFKDRAKKTGTITKLVSAASDRTKQNDLPAINAKYKGLAKTSESPHILKGSRVPVQKAYREEVRKAYEKNLNDVARETTSKSGNLRYEITPTIFGAKTATRWRVKAVRVQHAIEDEYDIIPVFDDDDFIIDFKIESAESTLTQTIELGAEFIAHYGVKGMRWGVQKERFQSKLHERRVQAEEASRAKRPAQDVLAYPTIGTSKRKKAKVDTKGGVDHPPTEDAIKVAVAAQKIKKSGTAALSNQELQELQRRLNLEQDVERLMKGQSSAGKRFVDGVFGRGDKNARRDPNYQLGDTARGVGAPLAKKAVTEAAKSGKFRSLTG